MNRRIRKKKQKLEAMHASKYKYAKLGRKRAHAVAIESRHFLWGAFSHEYDYDCYAMYLLRTRRCGKLEHKIMQHILSSKSLLKGGDCDESSYPEEETTVIRNARF